LDLSAWKYNLAAWTQAYYATWKRYCVA